METSDEACIKSVMKPVMKSVMGTSHETWNETKLESVIKWITKIGSVKVWEQLQHQFVTKTSQI